MNTFDQLRAVCRAAPEDKLALIWPYLVSAMEGADINTPARVQYFVANAAHESAEFARLEESLYYRSPERIMAVWPSRFPTVSAATPYVKKPELLANQVYANRMGNGAPESGEGWRFRGRGIFQLTGRSNYQQASVAIHGNPRHYINEPDLVAQPEDACLTAAWYWEERDLNSFADAGQFEMCVRKINGGEHGLQERTAYLYRAIEAMK